MKYGLALAGGGTRGRLTFGKMEECMEAGYKYTKEMIPRIQKALDESGV